MPADFSFPTTFVTFLAGEGNGAQKTLTLSAQNDDLVEGDQDVDVSVDTLADDFDGQVSVTNAGAETITIVDVDSATVTMTVNTNVVNEGNNVTVTLTLNMPGGETLEKNLVVDLTSQGVDALPADFLFPVDFVTFYAGAVDGNRENLTLTAQSDILVEGDQDVDVSVDTLADDFDGQVSVINSSPETITIIDADFTNWTLTQSAPTVDEGDSAIYELKLDGTGNAVESGKTATIQIDQTLLGPTTAADFAESHDNAVQNAVDFYNLAAGTSTGEDNSFGYDSGTGTITYYGDSSTALAVLTIDLNTFEDTNAGQAGHLANLVEPNEDFEIAISNPGGTVTPQIGTTGPTSLTTTIVDDDSAVVTIRNVQDATENPGTDGLFEIRISNPSQTSTIVNFTDGGPTMGTAEPGFDYVAILNTGINFSPGETSKLLSLDPIDDVTVEGPETVTLKLTDFITHDPQITIANSPDDRATSTITDNDATQLVIGNASVNEVAGTVTINVTLGLAVQNGFTVPYTLGGGSDTATGGTDYDNAGGTLTFAGTAGEIQTITISINNDSDVEIDEFFTVNLGTPMPNTVTLPPSLIDNSDTGEVSIDNDDIDLDLGVTLASQIEGDTGTTAFTFDVTRTGLISGTTTVNWELTGSGANSADADDFGGVLPSGTVTFAPGETIQTITILVNSDTVVEADEDFTVTLSSPADDDPETDTVEINTAEQIATIENEDIATLTVENVSFDEVEGTQTITVSVSNAVQGGFMVDFETSDGTATESIDYAFASGTLSFAGTAGEMNTFTIFINEDGTVEANETINVLLSNVVSMSVPTEFFDVTDVGIVTIDNNDYATLTVDDVTVNEDDTVTVTVSVDSAVQGGFNVDYATHDGTASNGIDNTSASGTLIFTGAAAEFHTFTFAITNDMVVELNETLNIELSNVDPAEALLSAFDASDTAIVTILDDDFAVLTVSDVTLNEENNLAMITVTVDNAVQGGFNIDFATSDGTANGLTDYTPGSGTLTFAGSAGESQTFEVAIHEDALIETDETFNVALSNIIASQADTSRIDTTDSSVVTIIDDESQTQVGETGKLTAVTDQWQTVTLNLTYVNPVVIAGPSSHVGLDRVVVRVRNVTSNSFEIRVDEWDYQDEGHAALERVHYMVIEAGTHRLPDGTVITAGNRAVNSQWTTVESGNAGGIVLTTVVTDLDTSTVTTRVRNVGATFQVRLQEEEAADGVHNHETVSWVQFGVGSGTVSGLQYVANQTFAAVTENNFTIEFGTDFGTAPVFLAGMQTNFGGDPATVRRSTLNGTQATVFIEEEMSADMEIVHFTENVGYLAIQSGIIEAVTANAGKVGETGVVGINHLWSHVNFSQPYQNPVVIMGSLSNVGGQGASPRIRNLTSTGFDVRVQEWDYLDGVHGIETVGYLVVEAGVHILQDGTTIVAGNTQGVTQTFQTVSFPVSFSSTPVVLSQATSINEPSAIVTRQRNVSTSDFSLRVQEQEADYVHAPETVSWIAIEQVTGSNNSLLFESDTTGNSVTDRNFGLTFNQTYNSTPAFFAQMQTFAGGDPSNVRYRTLDTSGSLIYVQEEASYDAELGHTFENVGYLAFEIGSIFSINQGAEHRMAEGRGDLPLNANPPLAQRFVSELPDEGRFELIAGQPFYHASQSTFDPFELSGSQNLPHDSVTDQAFAEVGDLDNPDIQDEFDLFAAFDAEIASN